MARSMLSRTASVFLLLCLVGTAARGQALVYEVDDEPLFQVEFPDGWVVDLDFTEEAREAGVYKQGQPLAIRVVEANPADGAQIWVGLWAVPGATTLDEGLEYAASLNADLFSNLEISTPRESEINGMAARVMTATAVYQEQDVELILALFTPRDGSVAAALYVGAADAWRRYESELRAMMGTLRPAG